MEGWSWGRDERARAKWAFVGGLNDESRTYSLSVFVGRVDLFTIRNPSDEDMKDSKRVEYVRADMQATRRIVGKCRRMIIQSHVVDVSRVS